MAISKPYEGRYSDLYSQVIRPLTVRSTAGLCSYPGCAEPVHEVHHSIYMLVVDGKPQQLAGNETEEMVGQIFFGLCRRHHCDRDDPECAHHWSNWKSGRVPPDFLDGRQDSRYWAKLRKGWLQKAIAANFSGIQTSAILRGASSNTRTIDASQQKKKHLR